MSSRIQVLRYPFSLEARSATQEFARDIGELVKFLGRPDNEYIIEEAESRVYSALTQSEIRISNTDDRRDVLIYPASRLIVEEIGTPRLKEYQAEAESKAVNKYLGQESDTFVMKLAQSTFGWDVVSFGDITQRAKLPILLRSYEFRIRFEDYLEVAPDFHSVEWKLVNRHVDNGYVPIRQSELNRLISGKFKQLIIRSIMDAPPLPARMIEAVQRIESEFKTKVVQTEPIEITDQVTTAFPPCIAQIHEDSIQGKNLPHEARFALASFLLKIGMKEDEVKSIFKPAPDFVSSLAEYQVHHIARKSAGEGYTPPGCKKMQGNSLCPVYLGTTFDPLCEYVLHPLFFYRTRAWEMTRPNPITDHAWYARKMRKRQNF
jgi:DNA primase large subunit